MNPSFSEHFKSRFWMKHVFYWIAFVLFFGLVWGISDDNYLRNILIQICCLPSRMLLVYVTLFYLFPKFFNQKKYFSFFISYCVLVALTSVFIQRPLFLYFIQPNFLPEFKNNGFFILSEIMNTALDINIAAMIPIAYTYLTTIENLEKNNSKLNEENKLLKEDTVIQDNNDDSYINLKVDKSVRKIKINDIIFVESLRNYCRIKLTDSEITVLKTLTSVQELLPESKFVRIHRSFLINKSHIISVSPSKIEINNLTIPVGRKYKDEVKEKLLVDF
ncbi:LytTR family DNA-binding domain-containing protein [Epilithonimonas sp.]|uniref:LytR/AlgR family response regulator transcription factor n=1 Tax=Epilithonimonas sp. TaxID=2894511 RepID=UPI00289946AD|nr:LytTR family DNA-binding domain-containing protein [Epilithonimonas sp.]